MSQHYTDANGRYDGKLVEHEVGRTTRETTERMHQLVAQLYAVRDPFVIDDIRRELAELGLAMQRLRSTLDRLTRNMATR